MMSSTGSVSDSPQRPQETQRWTVIVSSFGLTVLSGLLALTISRLPHHAWVEYAATGVTALFCLLPGLVCLSRPMLTAACGNVLAGVVALGLLARVASVMHGPVFADPSTSVFMPIFGFVPLLFMLVTLLATARVALVMNLIVWLAVLGITLPPMWGDLHGPDNAIRGQFQLTYFLLLGLPLTLLMLLLLVRARSNLLREQQLIRELATTRASLARAIQGSGVGLWQREQGSDGAMWWSDRMFDMLGLAPADHAPSSTLLRDLAHADDQAVFEVLEASNSQVSFDHAVRLRQPDGQCRWFAFKGEAVAATDGGVRLAGALLDIDERKRAELALHEARQLLDNIIRHSPSVIYAKDREARYLLVNRAWCRMLGVEQPELALGKTDDAFLEPEQAAHYQAEDRQVMTAGQALNQQETVVIDGVARTVLSTKFPLRDIGGQVSGVAGVATDISELQVAKERADALNVELERFVYIVSHDLSAPLRAARGFHELFLECFGDQLPDGSDFYLDQIQTAIDTMGRMLGAMLDLSRATRNAGPWQRIDMQDLLAIVFAELEDEFALGPVYLCVGALPPLVGEPKQLARALQCVVHNALKFRRPDGPVRIELAGELTPAGNRVQYQLRDNGIGFKPDHVDRMFRVYQRLNPDSRYPGLGMGLAIAEKIIRAHNGSISAQGELGQGACFTIELPQPADAG